MSRDQDRRDQLRRNLGELPELYALLPTFLLPGTRASDDDRHAVGGNPSRPTVNLDVADLLDTREKDAERKRTDYDIDRRATRWRDGNGKMTGSPAARRRGILPTLSSWVLMVDEDLDGTAGYVSPWVREACCGACFVVFAGQSETHGCCVGSLRPHPWGDRTVSGECSYLLSHLDWIVDQQWSDEIAADVKKMAADLRRETRQPIEEAPLPCLYCGWQMQGMGDFDTERHRYPWYRCTGCRKSITTQAELDRVQRKANDTVTLRYAAEELSRPFSTLREWKQRGWIQPLGKDSRGHVYSLAAIRKVGDSVRNGQRYEQVAK